MRKENKPWSPEILAFLEEALVKNNYDLKEVFRLILNSATYQLSSRTNAWNADDEAGFSHYRLRRLDAEVLLDAINQVTGGTEKYVSPIPEPFTYLPAEQRAIGLADGSIESPFLELFGRPGRSTSFESERTTPVSVLQAQQLLNSGQIQKKLEQSGPLILLFKKPTKIKDLYLTVLCRYPTPEEENTASEYLNSTKRKPTDSFCDLAWALLNSKEFLLKH
jgi:hypothetical protein